MPLEYDIMELGGGRPIWRDTKRTKAEANKEAVRLRDEEGKIFNISPRYESAGETENGFPVPVITAKELYERNHGKDADLSAADETVQRIYEACAETGNAVFEVLIKSKEVSA